MFLSPQTSRSRNASSRKAPNSHFNASRLTPLQTEQPIRSKAGCDDEI